MIVFHIATAIGLFFDATPVHGAPPQPLPVPHWVVLLVVVPALWLLISGTILLVEDLFGQVQDR